MKRGMGFCVRELLDTKELEKGRIISGEQGLDNEIKGVTIIEAPDIVKFIDGGEVLLTGLYAFKSCTVEEFQSYINELTRKSVSAIILKRGRRVEHADIKVNLLVEFAAVHGIPLIEVPFEIYFRKIMSQIMERLFNEEVTRLKYFKTTHDNFAALLLTQDSEGNKVEKIIDVLAKLIRNPVAVFNQGMSCLASTDNMISELSICSDAQDFDPGIYSNYRYLRQEKEQPQYIVQMKLSFGVRMYLVIWEIDHVFDLMDCIAIDNAITALEYEFSRQYAVAELEKKFQNDIMHNILNGKVHSIDELQKSTGLLGVSIDGSYRVLVFGMVNESNKENDFNAKIRYADILSEAISRQLDKAKIHNDMERIIVIQEVDAQQKQEEYRRTIKENVKEIQKHVAKSNKYLKIKAGAGRVVEGIINLPESYKEATDAFLFVDIAGDISEEDSSQVMLFSDLGIFKLLCQLDDSSMLLEYVPESLKKLYEYKKPQKEDLLITLRTYLDRNQNLSKTAQDLYVHYKTAAYRIEKISKITGIDFDNANEVLAVRIGLVVYKMIENFNKNSI